MPFLIDFYLVKRFRPRFVRIKTHLSFWFSFMGIGVMVIDRRKKHHSVVETTLRDIVTWDD